MNDLESEKNFERQEIAVEKPEAGFEDAIQGAELLEEPKGGSFISALQVFVAWVNNLLSGK
ncbi:MAG: hypothetical protein A3H72_03760 [Candidatus Doudnabacteria bacterium RIFCSPLOWO2_02_FULL_48_8]|uniref:Uncharacterized protein n=1 Tax=Candidatus Doudnabacteria bacterium RIFCSPHIGHO2_01_FULL_46_24 TaxID=1817825 RepID=A0A1F5NVI8_9BACT|nr:MAG: hypothetical protein A2720_02405 [Candidatus Doudnabacteria bacterium RIFCSPHIGHO2_01_FULL_46_24]OGE94202.1 MAG: hypothetical protein A3E98_00040 [Candidatus Doudnabacteria bacterium RIFCSPHIGHO2_12_FULL_48_11]OGE95330.1 MAG: hypothetical protein A3H72_03760 [Candidatus Doudnabacteria bacterium RIFCSPLOWO2_02_FULL_48_8]